MKTKPTPKVVPDAARPMPPLRASPISPACVSKDAWALSKTPPMDVPIAPAVVIQRDREYVTEYAAETQHLETRDLAMRARLRSGGAGADLNLAVESHRVDGVADPDDDARDFTLDVSGIFEMDL